MVKLLLKHLKKKEGKKEKLKLPFPVEKQKHIPGTDKGGFCDAYAEVSMEDLVSKVFGLIKTCDSLRINHQALLDYLEEIKGSVGVEDVFKRGREIRQEEAAEEGEVKLKLPRKLKLKGESPRKEGRKLWRK